jgi:hypothetical protein
MGHYLNDRIKELAEQADDYATEKARDGYSNYNLVYDRKFAELIVKECLKVCAEKRTLFQNESLSAQSQVGRDAWRDKRDGTNECVFDIKQHFGIKE